MNQGVMKTDKGVLPSWFAGLRLLMMALPPGPDLVPVEFCVFRVGPQWYEYHKTKQKILLFPKS